MPRVAEATTRAPPRPVISPHTVGMNAARVTNVTMRDCGAPSASRMAISFVRRATESLTMP